MWYSSLLPDHYDLAEMGYADYGGGTRPAHDHGHGTPVADLVEDARGAPDLRATLTVRDEGARYTVNGTSPGPELRATAGDLLELTLVNENVDEGVSLHWHGVDVPNAMDGVAGVTQDAVAPGDTFVYRFVAEEPGTYWYHSHQVSHEQVRDGLFGSIVIEPADGVAQDVDLVAAVHRYGNLDTVNGIEGTQTVDARPGDEVRVRVVNTNNSLVPLWVTGAPYRVLAVDGRDLNQPTDVVDRSLVVGAGGRVDLDIVVPASGARVDFAGETALVLGHDPGDGSTPDQPDTFLDLLSYGSPTEPGIDVTDPDREFDYRIDRRLGFLDGKPGRWWRVNGHQFPDVPMFMVEEGDVVLFHIDNSSGEAHPMHLHGHHVLVLSHNGREATGSPLWVDSLEVAAGEEYDVAFIADNPGIWMDHCHNLPHADDGLTAHLMYAGVTSSYEIGGDAGNDPE